MKKTYILAIVLCSLMPAAMLIGHQDDPKIRDRMPAYKGKGYKSAVPGSALAVGFDSENVQLLSWITLDDLGSPDSGNDCWGYISPSGREYALMGTSGGTAFVEITTPGNPQIIANISGPNSLWRDIKTYQEYAYAVSEGGGGIQIFDLSNIDNGVVQELNSAASGSTHNVAIDTTSGFLYRTGGSGGGGLRIYNLANPTAPQNVGEWQDRYVHDAQVITYTEGPYKGRQIAFCCGGFNGGWDDTGLTIVDVTNKNNIFVVSQAYYSNAGYSHQGWLTEDNKYFYLNDELDEQNTGSQTTTRIINVENINDPQFVGTFTSGTNSVDHNLYTKGNLIYEANYRSGIRIFDSSDPLNPEQIGYFDTYPSNDNASFNGLWSCYPYFPSGTVIGSDLERGLFVWEIGMPNPCEQPLGSCSNDVNGDGIVGVTDILTIIDNWGDCGDGTYRPNGDIDNDCCVTVSDLLQLIGAWGEECVITGACCLSKGNCEDMTLPECESAGGVYSGDDTTCETSTCPGAGDECTFAMTAALGQNYFETNSATASSPEPDESQCSGTYMNWDNSQDIWFEWIAEFSGNAHFTTCDSSSYDTSMALYEGSCDNQVTCNGDGSGDNDCQSWYSNFDYNVKEGTSYFIRIGGWQGDTGEGTLTIE